MVKKSLDNSENIYHYSNRTGKVEVCRASKKECPLRAEGFHSNNIVEIMDYADKENEFKNNKYYGKVDIMLDRAIIDKDLVQETKFVNKKDLFLKKYTKNKAVPDNIAEIIKDDKAMIEVDTSYFYLTNEEIPHATNHMINTSGDDVLRYFGLSQADIEFYSEESYYIVPLADNCITSLINRSHFRKYMFADLKDKHEKSIFGIASGDPYDERIFTYAFTPGYNKKSILAEADVRSPHNTFSYTMKDVWNDFVQVNLKLNKAKIVNKRNQDILIIKTPKLYDLEKETIHE